MIVLLDLHHGDDFAFELCHEDKVIAHRAFQQIVAAGVLQKFVNPFREYCGATLLVNTRVIRWII